MHYFINGLAMLASFALMEFTAWFAHKYVMHTFGWVLHKDHHLKDHDSTFELNDLYFSIFAIPGILLIFYGYNDGLFDVRFWIGMGITLYGFAYLFVHDVFIHQRIKIFTRTDNVYFAAMRKAHKVHHKHLGKEDGECFGFLWVPRKYIEEARKRKMS
ncbi:MAG: sterol desaturase family protein [Calditrichae bacterium]|nr:sterol desaturase family protein [Calditrichota bacterium]MCB9057017.1 sterol desaturase family protein [Calditrichia bacterium]